MGDDALRMVEQLKRDNLEAQRQEKDLLKKHGLPENTMCVCYKCQNCNDTGFSDDGRFCECHKRLLKHFEHERLGKLFPLERYTFDSFVIDFYPKELQEYMRETKRFCRAYATRFNTQMPSLFFCGESGLGKTHLSGAIINEVIKGGSGVEYGSAPLLFSQLISERFDNHVQELTLRAFLAADLAVIDDLGAEAPNAIAIDLLYTIINTRLGKRLPTIINSNCTPRDLQDRYGRRIASRLLYDEYRAFSFSGTDVREQKMDS
jgi:DNA replication protein DnaC